MVTKEPQQENKENRIAMGDLTLSRISFKTHLSAIWSPLSCNKDTLNWLLHCCLSSWLQFFFWLRENQYDKTTWLFGKCRSMPINTNQIWSNYPNASWCWLMSIKSSRHFLIRSQSIALVIVSLININNWPYLGINYF